MLKTPRHNGIKRAAVFALSALYIGFSAWIGLRADDTAIYVNKVPAAQTPNVLFSIDTSGSMSNNVPGGGQTRMEAVKDALTGLVKDTSNLKAGLGRFHRELGGPIIFPVVNLDEAPDFLNESVVVSSIDRSSDDAEELDGTVILNSNALEITEVSEGGSLDIVEIEARPQESRDDDEKGNGRGVKMTSDDIDDADAGIRFRDVAVPRGATILHAEIEFVNNENSYRKSDKVIYGEKVSDPPRFSNNGPSSINDRFSNKTDARMPWSNISENIDADDAVTTPNLYSIVQEIVNLDGWTIGNSMTMLLENIDDNHEFSSFDGDFPPVLRIKYVEDATVIERQIDATPRDANEDADGLERNFNGFYLIRDLNIAVTDELTHAGLIFPDVDIPESDTVVWADLEFLARFGRDSDPVDMAIHGIDDPELSGFSPGNLISTQPTTSAQVDWHAGLVRGDEEIFTPGDDEPMFSPNLAALVEEVRSNSAFDPEDSGDNNIGFVFSDGPTDGINQRTMCSFDGVSDCPETEDQRPTLRLVYGTPVGATTSRQEIGLRFNNIRVPQGATIESAHIDFTVDGETSEPGDLKIEIENNTEPGSFSNNPGEKVSDRSYAGSSVSWTTEPWSTIGETRQSPDLSSLVSQVTGQADWCGGGSLAFRITSENAKKIAESWDRGGSGAPTLRIDYDASGLTAGEGCTTRQLTVPINDSDDDVEEYTGGGWFDGWIDFDSGDLDVEDDYLVGLRFTGVDVPQGAKITGTNLLLTADDPTPDSGTNDITIRAQQHPNAPPFSSNNGDVSSRNASAPSIVWTEETEWIEGDLYSPQDDGIDLTPLIQDIIDGTVEVDGETWASGNALVFTLESSASSSRDRDVEVCCNQADPPAALEIFYEVKLGDLGVSGTTTGRQAILNIIDDLVADGFTPPVDAMYEAAAYFKSDPVHFGRTRGAGERYDGNSETSDGDLDWQIRNHTDAELLYGAQRSRLSHFATYTPQDAEVVRDGNCTENNPNDPDCATEHIANSASPTYVSPFDSAEACERGFLVLLSDGIANRNSSRELIKDISGAGSCNMDIPNIDANGDVIIDADGSFNFRNPSSDEMCGLELVDYLDANDFIDEPGSANDVRNNVRTFTIGFDLEGNTSAVEFLKALAFVGNGGNLDDPEGVENVRHGDGFFTADNAAELQLVFETILSAIIDDTTSFVAPGISINAFNRLFNLDDIYFSLFRPDDNAAWLGNLKKFKLCTDQSDCEFGETIDRLAQPAVNDDPGNLDTYGTLKTAARGFWSGDNDSAPEIDEGGAGARIPTFDERNVYINTSSEAVADPDFDDPVATQGAELYDVDLSTDTGGTPSEPDGYNSLKSALLDSNNCDSGNADMDAQNTCLNELIEWMAGKWFAGDRLRHSEDENIDGDRDRWAFGDPMHSRPLVLTYGKDTRTADNPDDDVPLSKIFVGTNDGGIRMINEGDGIEEWIFFPNSMLGMQSRLKENPKGVHEYGIDDTPTARLRDDDGDGVIEPDDDDFVHIYFGLRRGGRQVFALNVTPDSAIGVDSQQTLNGDTENEFNISIGEKGKVTPEILWRIDGSDPEFQRLGQTWSTPRPVRVAGSSGARSVLIFGGGYDTNAQDGIDEDGTSPDGGDKFTGPNDSALGNAIFMVDADTGERLWWASSSPDGNDEAADANVPDMNTSIAAPVTMLDTNGDSLVDRLYAVDMRGQVFRVDIAATSSPATGESEFSSSSVGVLAQLGSESTNAARRKFFYAPEVARVQDDSLTGEAYELIGIVSGNRANPQARTVQDRAYGIRDFLTENPGDLTTVTFPKCNPQADNCPTANEPLSHNDLQDVTEKAAFVIRNEDGSTAADTDDVIDELKKSHGWFFDLEGDTFDDPDATELSGEKGFSAATVLDGKMFFTTFLPPEETADIEDACSVPEVLGTSRFYAVDFFTGAPAFDRNNDSSFDKVERFKNVGAGPSSDIIPAYLPGGVTLPVPTGAGAIAEDPEVSSRVNKTFWLEER